MDGVRRSTAITAFAAICLALGIAACGVGEELPTFPPPRDVIIVTATPEPTRPPAPTLTPTPNLSQLARINAPKCLAAHQQEQFEINGQRPYEVLTYQNGSAVIKAGYYGNSPDEDIPAAQDTTAVPHLVYWLYRPGPVYGTFGCKIIHMDDHPRPTPDPRGGEERIKQVALIADEVCRTRINDWRQDDTFMDTQSLRSEPQSTFTLLEVRPTTEQTALVMVRHDQRDERDPDHRQWLTNPDRYLLYSVHDNSCRESAFSAQAWEAWPEILPTPTPQEAR